MHRVCILKSTNKLLEVQSGGDDDPDLMEMRLLSLKENAIRAGYKDSDIVVKWVTDEEYITLTKASLTYVDLRIKEYPSIYDYIDGIVKEDQAQINKYIADCIAVKTKYPKPGA